MATKLQKVSRSVNYTIGFRMQPINIHIEGDMPVSECTTKLIEEANKSLTKARDSLKLDYRIFKINELSKREK